ncbi:DUF2470 domain-containing protein [Thiotrichales bacterium 19S3-7]|nr:DUF2470 domain-containing protein [Thiotrichales bacterium 19S3-7]MCF6802843.1 DUF2470 domain-containing protein [Thiotrichales bacterium 19S3-11]
MLKETSSHIAYRARNVTKTKTHGILATQSVPMDGYPFGSLVQYCFDYYGDIIILISRLAQHTRNILKDPKVSLTILDEQDYIQNSPRVTLIGDATLVNSPSIAERYYRFFPEAKNYHQTHDFDFYRINLKKIRFIGGFGDIHWVKKEDFSLTNPFDSATEKSAIDHMNDDHKTALVHYLTVNKIRLNAKKPIMAGCDQEGFWITLGYQCHYIEYNYPVEDTRSLRKVLAEMAKTPLSA